jgi:hypothetical protein
MVSRLKRNEAMANERVPMRAPWGDIAPRLTEISDTVLFDDVWRRPGLNWGLVLSRTARWARVS